MISDVYVRFEDGVPITRNFYDAWRGFKLRGHRVFSFENLDNVPLTKETIICAGIPCVQDAWSRLGLEIPAPINYPECLHGFMGRNIGHSTIGEIRENISKQKSVFIKPFNTTKTFTGFVVRSTKDLYKISHLQDDVKILTSDCVSFKSEWRVYVLENDILGVGHYFGDSVIFPNSDIIKIMVKIYRTSNTAPIAFALDVGIREDNNATTLVEVNDSYALGNYSLPSTLYAKMIEARWNQIVGIM